MYQIFKNLLIIIEQMILLITLRKLIIKTSLIMIFAMSLTPGVLYSKKKIPNVFGGRLTLMENTNQTQFCQKTRVTNLQNIWKRDVPYHMNIATMKEFIQEYLMKTWTRVYQQKK